VRFIESEWLWDGLDPTEQQIAELLVQGESNAAICAEVFLSKARVGEYIKRIVLKTGANSTRAVIALLAAERETQALLRILDQASDGVVIVQDRIVTFANRTFHGMHGYAPGELKGRPLTEFLAPRSWDFVTKQRKLIANGEPFALSYEIAVLRKGGEQKIALVVRAGHVLYRGREALLVTFPHTGETI
jgi:PAS domain S-box-containing protein